jgi:hypothetical protein
MPRPLRVPRSSSTASSTGAPPDPAPEAAPPGAGGSTPAGTPLDPPSSLATTFPDPIPGVIDFGTVNILAGAAGVGKTTLFVEWCTRWRDGRTICGYPTQAPTGLYYLSTDRGGHSTQRLFAAQNLANVNYYNPLDDPYFDRKQLRTPQLALGTLRWCVDKLNPQPGSHLAIDPAAPFFVPGSQNEPRAVACLLWELHIIARERQITIFPFAHFSKQSADHSQRYHRPQDRISGSGAWVGFSDTQMFMVDPEPPEQPYHIFGWNPRHAPPEEFKFLRSGPSFIPYRSLDDLGSPILHNIPESARELFLLIPDGGTTSENLQRAAAEFLGISRATFFRLLAVLESKGVIQRPHGYVKRIPVEQVRYVPDSESDHKAN